MGGWVGGGLMGRTGGGDGEENNLVSSRLDRSKELFTDRFYSHARNSLSAIKLENQLYLSKVKIEKGFYTI